MKRVSAFLRAVFLLMFLGVQIVLPVKAYAFVFVPAVVTAAGSALYQAAVGVAVGGAIFAGVGSLGGDSSQSSSAVSHVPMSNDAIFKPPSNWTRDASGLPVPNQTVPSSTQYKREGYSQYFPSPEAVAQSYGSSECSSRGWGSLSRYEFNWDKSYVNVVCSSGNQVGFNIKSTSNMCPAGYSGSGTCTLSDASAVKKPADTPCQIIRTGNSFAYDSQNPACPTGVNASSMIAADGSTIGVNGGTVTVVPAVATNSTTPEATKPKVTVTPNADGSTTVNQQFTYTYNNQTYVSSVNTQIGADGKVQGQAQTTQAGSGTLAQPGAVNPEQKAITCTDIGTCDVAKDGTLQGVKTGVEQVRDKLTVEGASPTTEHDPLYVKGTKTLDSVWQSFKGSLASTEIVTFVSGFFNVDVGGQCPTWSTGVGMGLSDVVIDHLCTPMADNMFLIVKGVLLVLAGWAAFRIAIDN